MSTESYLPNSVKWERYWPTKIVTLVGTLQGLLSFCVLVLQAAIVGIGIGALCNDVVTRYIIGFVAWLFFEVGSIATCCLSCCNRSSIGCATFTFVMNILAFVFSAVLIDFDRKFIDYPLFDNTLSTSSSCSYYSYDNTETDWLLMSVNLTKGQLAAVCLILVLSLAYVGIYIYTYIRTILDKESTYPLPTHEYPPVVRVAPAPYVTGSYPRTGYCPTCGVQTKTSE